MVYGNSFDSFNKYLCVSGAVLDSRHKDIFIIFLH